MPRCVLSQDTTFLEFDFKIVRYVFVFMTTARRCKDLDTSVMLAP